MKTRWVLVERDGKFVPDKIVNHVMKDQVFTCEEGVVYHWQLRMEGEIASYICTVNDKQVGFIPLQWEDNDPEMNTFWEGQKRRGLETLADIMKDMMSRHLKRHKRGSH